MSIVCWWIYCTHVDSCLVAGNVMLSSSVAYNGRQFTCPGEIVLFTCQVFGSLSLEWNSPLVSPVTYTAFDTPPPLFQDHHFLLLWQVL